MKNSPEKPIFVSYIVISVFCPKTMLNFIIPCKKVENCGNFSFHTLLAHRNQARLGWGRAAKPIFYATVLKCRERN